MRTSNYLAFLLLFTGLILLSCEKDDEPGSRIYYPTNGLISYFKFNNNLMDELGNTPDGTNINNATFVDGVDGKAIQFNGIDQSVVFDRKSYRDGNKISVSFWLFQPLAASLTQFIISCNDFGVATSMGGLAYAISLPITNSAIGSFEIGEWTHFVGTYDGTDIKVYINGELAQTTNHPGDIEDLDKDLTIGSFMDFYWEGAVDEMFIYNRVLTPEEALQLYNR